MSQIEYTEGSASLVQIWDVRGPTFVREDWRPGDRFRAQINLPAAKHNSLEKMLFNVALCTGFAKDCSGFFNERLTEDGRGDWDRKTTRGEVVKMWGYLVALAFNPSAPVADAWATKSQPGDLFTPLQMGRHGMHKNRFRRLEMLQGTMFTKDEDELDENDPWRYCRSPLEAFNARRTSLINPSWLMVLDEAMSAWTGAEGVEAGKGVNFKPIPFLSQVERKPEPLGGEIKVAADGISGCFLNLEIQEGASAHSQLEYYAEYGHTAATSLRLLKPWFKGPRRPSEPWFKGPEQPPRACYADSWFMGVNQMEAVFMESGKVMHFFGDVKTNTSRFPAAALRNSVGPHSGDWATFTTEVDLPDFTSMRAMAVAHRRGPEVHTYLSSAGVTTQGAPQKHKDDFLDADTRHAVPRKCPAVLNDATTAQPKIDRGNRRRQYDLAMEKRFRTEAFPFRLFTTILGISITDCYYLDMYHNKTTYGFREAVQRMAWAMIYNNLDKIDAGLVEPTDLFQRPAAEADLQSAFTHSPSQSGMSCGHIPVPLHCIPGYTGSTQQNCAVCVANGVTEKVKTSYCCVICSTKDYVVALHPPYFTQGKPTGWRCHVAHRRNPNLHPGTRPRVKKGRAAAAAAAEEDDDEEGEEEEGEEEEAVASRRSKRSRGTR